MDHSFQPFVRYAVKTRYFLPRVSVARDCRLLYVLSGCGSFESGEETYPLEKSSLIYYPCGVSYRIFSDANDGLLFYTVNFDFTQEYSYLTDTLCPVSEKAFDAETALKSYGYFDSVFSKIKYIPNAMFAEPLLQSICREYADRQSGFGEMQRAQMTVLLLNFCRAVYAEAMQDPVCMQIRSLVAEDISRNNEAIAEILGYHPYYLNTVFKRCEGITLHQYILQQRLSRAYELITSSYLSIGEIALSCGFSSQSYFSSLFQKRYHIRPLSLRRQM